MGYLPVLPGSVSVPDYSDESGHPIPEQSGQLFC